MSIPLFPYTLSLIQWTYYSKSIAYQLVSKLKSIRMWYHKWEVTIGDTTEVSVTVWMFHIVTPYWHILGLPNCLFSVPEHWCPSSFCTTYCPSSELLSNVRQMSVSVLVVVWGPTIRTSCVLDKFFWTQPTNDKIHEPYGCYLIPCLRKFPGCQTTLSVWSYVVLAIFGFVWRQLSCCLSPLPEGNTLIEGWSKGTPEPITYDRVTLHLQHLTVYLFTIYWCFVPVV